LSFFPDQLESITLSLDQLKCLSSVERHQVFWCYAPNEGRAAAQVARELGKSAQVVHYHTQALLEVGLLRAVGTQKKRSRTEHLYAWAMATFRHELTQSTPEYRQESLDSFRATTREMVREMEDLHAKAVADPSVLTRSMLRRRYVRIPPELLPEARRRLTELLDWIHENRDLSGEAERYHVLGYVAPSKVHKRRGRAAKDHQPG